MLASVWFALFGPGEERAGGSTFFAAAPLHNWDHSPRRLRLQQEKRLSKLEAGPQIFSAAWRRGQRNSAARQSLLGTSPGSVFGSWPVTDKTRAFFAEQGSLRLVRRTFFRKVPSAVSGCSRLLLNSTAVSLRQDSFWGHRKSFAPRSLIVTGERPGRMDSGRGTISVPSMAIILESSKELSNGFQYD